MIANFDFIGPINDENILCLRNYIEKQEDQIEHLIINISSLGGSVTSGITIYNYLKHKRFPITTHNLGEVTSGAILLYLAGINRTAEPISKFLIHPVSVKVNENLRFYQVQEILNGIDADIKNYSAIVNKETNNLNSLFDIDTYLRGKSIVLDVQHARECGLITQNFD